MTPKPNRDLIWAEVDLSALGHNVAALKKAAGTAQFMAVVKANAYGHGALPVAKRALQSGADWLGVARLDEALALRSAGIEAPILVFGHTSPERADELADNDVRPTVYTVDTAGKLSRRVSARGLRIRVHIKIDSGMGRLGILPDAFRPGAPPDAPPTQAAADIAQIWALPGLAVEGIYTHFASADDADKTSARKQLSIFSALLTALKKKGLSIPLCHAANSAAIIDLPEAHLDMVRAGISLYGLAPSAEVGTQTVGLKPAMSLKARIVHLKQVPAGFAVSYGSTYRTAAPTTIATVPVGYADGYSRNLSNRGHMLVRGIRAPIAGRVCMDQTMLDVGHIAGVEVGDEVVVFGSQNGTGLPADELAELLGTINYEIVSAVMERVPRVYVG